MSTPTVAGSCFCGAVRFEVDLPTLFCESSRHPERIDVTLASMKGPIDREPQAHVYYDCRVDWIENLEELPKPGGAGGTRKLE